MSDNTLQFLRDAKFGLFVHWGLYAVPGGRYRGQVAEYIGEWIQSRFRIPAAEYANFLPQFNPTRFDADDWLSRAAAAGMKYLVFTAKHHDGFAMFRSRCSPFNIYDATPFRRDPLAELAAACPRHGIRFGLYYSHDLDWNHPDGGDPGPDFPKSYGMSWGNDWDFPDFGKKRFARYFHEKALPQVTELLTNYGPVAEIWFDCPVSIEKQYSVELRALVKKLQPECQINSRIGHDCGDFGSLGDNQLAGSGSDALFESPGTLNDSWGYKYDDHRWKTPETIVRQLVALADRNANYLLNVGPQPDGAFPEETCRILAAVADWYQENGRGVFATRGNPFPQEFAGAECTVAGNRLNFFITKPAPTLEVRGLRNRVVAADVPFTAAAGKLTLDLAPVAGRTIPLVAVEVDGAPDIDPRLMPVAGTLLLSPATAAVLSSDADTAERPVLEQDGTLGRWNDPQRALAWNCVFPEGGRYAVTLTTRNRAHGEPWAGDRVVAVEWNGRRLEKTVVADRALDDSEYYWGAETDLGEITVAAGEAGTVKLSTLRLLSPLAEVMAMETVRLTRRP